MTQVSTANTQLTSPAVPNSKTGKRPISLFKFSNLLGITHPSGAAWIEKLPFAGDDATAGSETELQAAVAGESRNVDLARAIETSAFFKNLLKRARSGDAPARELNRLENYLSSMNGIWENSWVRFPEHLLNKYAGSVLNLDLRADKRMSDGPFRSDAESFHLEEGGIRYLRVPISYLLKLTLAQVIGGEGVPDRIRSAGEHMLTCLLNDNTSPETHSFCPESRRPGRRLGTVIAHETLLRYLLTQLLLQYANREFKLEENGQKALVYFCPHPPVRQKELNGLISDAFYRHLFMSPCLSGWDQGEMKHRYMALCHMVLSRSQLNTLGKLKEAGIINRNLVVLPSTSNICLANNGIHLSLGSRRLTEMLKDGGAGYSPVDEKYYGDLVIKISEHFLPLFVGTYSAAPYRFDFQDFHPEKVLGFLPHELDYTHLRMLWRRWKQKADIKLFGRPITPFGPEWLDRTFSRMTGLKGDWVQDYRVIDYLMAVLSTDESPSLNGQLGNDLRLKEDLAAMGVFDPRMPLYMLLRLRQYKQMGFSGYEARFYSLFERFGQDMAPAVDLQNLITLLAYKYILERKVQHADIPDNPTVESERRQIFFGSAIGIPTFYVLKDNPNRLMREILALAGQTRSSRRYPNYIRIPAAAYRRALLDLVKRDARDLIAMLDFEEGMKDLEWRLEQPAGHAAAFRLMREVLGSRVKSPLKLDAAAFNGSMESYYRCALKQSHIREAFSVLREEAGRLDAWESWRSVACNIDLLKLMNGCNTMEYFKKMELETLDESLSSDLCQKLIQLILLTYDQRALRGTGI